MKQLKLASALSIAAVLGLPGPRARQRYTPQLPRQKLSEPAKIAASEAKRARKNAKRLAEQQ